MSLWVVDSFGQVSTQQGSGHYGAELLGQMTDEGSK